MCPIYGLETEHFDESVVPYDIAIAMYIWTAQTEVQVVQTIFELCYCESVFAVISCS